MSIAKNLMKQAFVLFFLDSKKDFRIIAGRNSSSQLILGLFLTSSSKPFKTSLGCNEFRR